MPTVMNVHPSQENSICFYLPLRCQSYSESKCPGSFSLIILPLALEVAYSDHSVMKYIGTHDPNLFLPHGEHFFLRHFKDQSVSWFQKWLLSTGKALSVLTAW